MLKTLTAILTLTLCSTALAEPILYVCERPAWDGQEGCGLNNTYATYSMLLDTKDFDHKYAYYTLRSSKGCDANKGRRQKYRYLANDETISFALDLKSRSSIGAGRMSTIELDLDSMKAVMSKVKDSPELTCRVGEI